MLDIVDHEIKEITSKISVEIHRYNVYVSKVL